MSDTGTPLRHHLSFSPMKGSRWQCNDCGAKGTFEELESIDCPNGQAPIYGKDVPDLITLHEERDGPFLRQFRVIRGDDYTRDENFERAMRMKDDPRFEGFRRLGGVRGTWFLYSAIDGSYVGSESDVKWLRKYGIAPQAIVRGEDERDSTASIGFSEQEQKWYGWSHRAAFGFGIGHVVKPGSVEASSYVERPEPGEVVREHQVPPGFECETLDDCKLCAICFAEEVS